VPAIAAIFDVDLLFMNGRRHRHREWQMMLRGDVTRLVSGVNEERRWRH
jgi:hypothetical protein